MFITWCMWKLQFFDQFSRKVPFSGFYGAQYFLFCLKSVSVRNPSAISGEPAKKQYHAPYAYQDGILKYIFCIYLRSPTTEIWLINYKKERLENRKYLRYFFDFWKLSGFYNNLMFFQELFEVLSWFEGTILQEIEEHLSKSEFKELFSLAAKEP